MRQWILAEKMQINLDFCYYQLHQNKQAAAGPLLDFDKSAYWMISLRDSVKLISFHFLLYNNINCFILEHLHTVLSDLYLLILFLEGEKYKICSFSVLYCNLKMWERDLNKGIQTEAEESSVTNA